MRKRLGDFLPLILVVVGLGILLYPTVSNFLVERNASRVISNYDAAVANLTEEEYAQMLDDAHAYNSKVAALAGVQPIDGSIDVSGISAETLRQEYNGLLNLNGDGMMGYLTIPSLDVTMPIYHTVEEPVLQVGAGHVETSSLPVGGSSTHSVLSGHRGLPSAKLFTELDKLAVGDQFYIRVLNEMFAYEVDSILTVLPHETESLAIAEGEDLCTLVTCTPYAINSHRLLVRGHAIPYEESMDEAVGKAVFSPLEPGLYLIIRSEVAPANTEFSCDPALVSVPTTVNGVFAYTVEVTPKFEHDPLTPGSGPGEDDKPADPLDQLADKVAGALGFAKTSDGMFALACAAALCAFAAVALLMWRRRATALAGAHAAGAKRFDPSAASASDASAAAKRAEAFADDCGSDSEPHTKA